MATCEVRWRPSGGRGEFEYVPAETLLDRAISVIFEDLDLTIQSEVKGKKVDGKPRLRRDDKNDRKKYHLPQLVMAVARLPEPARQDKTHVVAFPLENKSFVMDSMGFEIIDDDGMTATLAPLWVTIRNTNVKINLEDRFSGIAKDIKQIGQIAAKHPDLADAIQAHNDEIMKAVNSKRIGRAVDRIVAIQTEIFGKTNIGSAVVLEKYSEQPETEPEAEIIGKEGRLLTRIHVYKERDRAFALMAKKYYKDKNGGKLDCQACGLDPVQLYGADGEKCIEAHHTIPIEELQPDSETRVYEMAMVCASCHRIIHTKKPCIPVNEVVQPAHAG